jgi:Uma2 family endonuclease
MQPPAVTSGPADEVLPDHTQLPCEDGTFVQNFQEHPQTNLLTSCLLPRLRELHPNGQFCIGHDSGIYYRFTKPPLDGCRAPDWFYVPGVPPTLEGQVRRSYVMWQESVRPLMVVEVVSGDGSEERDTTPHRGKFWIYEQAIGAAYYALYEGEKGAVELYQLAGGRYQRVTPNAAGRLPVEPLGVELGIWQGTYRGVSYPWLRVWDSKTGELLLNEEERAEAEKQRAETAESLLDDARRRLEEECERAEAERRRAERIAERMRAAGLDPDAP